MSGSKRNSYQASIQRRLEALFLEAPFRDLLDLRKNQFGGKEQLSLLRHYGLSLDALPVLWEYANTGTIDYSLINEPLIGVLDETAETMNGIPLDHIFLANDKRPKQMLIMLNPEVGKTATLEYINKHWDDEIEPGLKKIRYKQNKVVRAQPSLKAHLEIVEMRKTMKPKEIAIKKGVSQQYVYDVLARYKKKTSRPK